MIRQTITMEFPRRSGMRLIDFHGEEWRVESGGGSHGTGTGNPPGHSNQFQLLFTRLDDGFDIRAHVAAESLEAALQAESERLCKALGGALYDRQDWVVSCPQGHPVSPRFTGEELYEAVTAGAVRIYCLRCGSEFTLSDIERSRLLKWAHRRI